jgi:hypothetical protein
MERDRRTLRTAAVQRGENKQNTRRSLNFDRCHAMVAADELCAPTGDAWVRSQSMVEDSTGRGVRPPLAVGRVRLRPSRGHGVWHVSRSR